MTRHESFLDLVYRHLADSQRLRVLAKIKTSHDLWPPREAKRIARELRETAEEIDKIAEREPDDEPIYTWCSAPEDEPYLE